MQHTPIITEEKLDTHADYAESRGIIPDLVLRLICASIQNPNELRIPVGGSVGQQDWDGILVSPTAFEPYVPAGQSFWELGTGADPASKATSDFKKRTDQTSDDEQAASTFVFVTPRSGYRHWNSDSQRKWLQDRKSTKWKDIKIVDGTKLAQWLFLFPEIDFWLADQFGLPTHGLTTPALHWKNLHLYGFPPELKAKVFLIERDEAVRKLVKLFEGDTHELLLQTRYPEEGIDFVSAALASLPLAEQSAFASRCLIIDDPATWKVMCTLQTPHVFVAHPVLDVGGPGADLRQQAKTHRHAVIFSGNPGIGSHGNSVRLHEANSFELAKALEESGYDSERARKIAGRCGGTIPILKRLLLDLSASPQWAVDTEAAELALATLIGRWNANLHEDREAVEESVGKEYGEWIRILRPLTLRPDPPLIQRDERWKFVSRFEGWQTLGRFLFDSDVDRFQKVALRILNERDPKLKLPPDERWKFIRDAERRPYSDIIREGVAETLALLGSYPKALTSCSIGKPESISVLTVRQVLENRDWELWASLNDVFPLLAEAAPDEFLDAVEKVLADRDNVFRDLFSQERSGISGINYMTGLLWALETLAWSSDYLARVTVILGELAEIDPGGNWANRPVNSLATIFLPWFPQTCAPIPNRRAAVETLVKESPKIGWKLLLNLLPSSHGFSSGTRKPAWREFIPANYSEKITIKDYSDQVAAYADLAMEIAATNPGKLVELIDKFPELPAEAQARLVGHLSSKPITDLAVEDRTTIWEALERLVTKHKKYADAQWAMAPAAVGRIEEVANRLRPEKPEFFHRRLFNQHDFELMDEKGDFERQREELDRRRQTAIEELLDKSGIDGVLAFAKSVSAPGKVGAALAATGPADLDKVLLPHHLRSGESWTKQFIAGFVWRRFWKNKWGWVDNNVDSSWTVPEKKAFLLLLPFETEAWKRAKEFLGEHETEYWAEIRANPYQAKGHLLEAAERFLANARPSAAMECIDLLIHDKGSPSADLVVRVLKENLTSKEPASSLDQHVTIELINWLQTNRETKPDDLFQIEWSYLPLLDRYSGGTPKHLEARLATDPEFYCELIRTIFRSEHEKSRRSEERPEEQKRIAQNAYRLLMNWKTPPGKTGTNGFDSKKFNEWLAAVQKSAEKSGHLNIAMSQLGQVLPYVPPDPGGLWIHKTVAEALNAKSADKMRSGFTTELFNMRGVHGFTAGKEELELATKYRQRADDVEAVGFHRVATAVRELAGWYERQAKREAARNPFEDV
jgi:hypothetical protein